MPDQDADPPANTAPSAASTAVRNSPVSLVAEEEQLEKNLEVKAVAVSVDPAAKSNTTPKSTSFIKPRTRTVLLRNSLAWALLTAYFATATALNFDRDTYAYLALVYAFVTGKLVFFHFAVSGPIKRACAAVWRACAAWPLEKMGPRARKLFYAVPFLGMVCAIVLNPESEYGTLPQRLVSFGGMFAIISLLVLFSKNRRAIDWKTVTVGLAVQLVLGVFIFRTAFGAGVFSRLAALVTDFLDFNIYGAKFVLGDDIYEIPRFAVIVLPTVVFFAAFIQIVYYLGAMQWVIEKVAWLMVRLMDTSGAESVVAVASPFVGQGESALLVKPFLKYMTNAELHSVMTSGFSTIAGGVLIAFIKAGIDAKALITSCVTSVPCSLAISKLRVPETEVSLSKGHVAIPEAKNDEVNILHAAGNGAAQGMHLIALIAGSMLAIISLYELANHVFAWVFSFLDPRVPVTIQLLLSYVFWPFAVIIGVPLVDCARVAELMGVKIVVNEFVAYMKLADMQDDLTPRGRMLATFALCGFANIASIGIQIGCLGAMAPERKRDLARLALSAMVCGTLSTFMMDAQTEKAFQKQPIFANAKVRRQRDRRWFKDVGLGFKTPREAIEGTYIDKKCPFTGDVAIRGRILTGVVVSSKMRRTVVIRRDYLHYVKKYNRYEKRHKNLAAHLSPAFVGVGNGDTVTVGQCRPLSKTVRFNVLRVNKKATGGGAKQFSKF